MLHKLPGYQIICEIKSRHHVQDMRPGVSRLNTLSQVDRIGIPFSGRPVPCTPSLWQNYVTESQIRCPDSEDVPRDKVLDSEPAQLKPRCPIVKLPWREWERSREDLMLNEQTLPDVISVTANNDNWWQCNLGEWIKPALGLGVATSIIWLADTSSFFTNQRWYIFKYFLRLPFLTKVDYV